jgi:hypothetical protein
MKFSDNPDAQRYLKRHYRDGWQVSVICTPQEMLQQGNEHA